MPVVRFDHVGAVVADLDEAVRFLLALGFAEEGRAEVGGTWVDRVIGLPGVRSEIVMLRAPGDGPAIELSRFQEGGSASAPEPLPANAYGFRHIAYVVTDVDEVVERARAAGYGPVRDVVDYEGVYRLAYLRGPEGLLVEVAQELQQSR